MTITYTTIIEPVLEVSLIGEANFVSWQPKLEAEGLDILHHADKIPVILSAVEATYMGMMFREFSISLAINDSYYFLAHAYNSKRFFAFVERRLFRTPYYHATITTTPHKVAIHQNQKMVFEAILPEDAPITSQKDENFEWQISLPKSLRKKHDVPHYFYARLEGHSHHYDAKSAQMTISPSPTDEIFALLEQSEFTIKNWLVRPHGRHSKSKTYLKE
ncbi:MAG: hypothetical protein SFZ02_17680 [bacterium]|nr:hypothetical protein [bacterium]